MGAGDSMNGGKSMAKIEVVDPGAANSKGALQVTGEVVAGGPFLFAGALYSPGAAPMQPANLSGKRSIGFWAKGDGKSYTLLVLTESRNGQSGEIPAMTTFVAGPEWKQYMFPFATFDTDGSDLSGIGFIRVQEPGKFQFQIDQVEFKYLHGNGIVARSGEVARMLARQHQETTGVAWPASMSQARQSSPETQANVAYMQG